MIHATVDVMDVETSGAVCGHRARARGRARCLEDEERCESGGIVEEEAGQALIAAI